MNKILVCLALTATVLTSCVLFSGVRKMDNMTDVEFVTYVENSVLEVAIIASAALSEGDVTLEGLNKLAATIEEIAAGDLRGSIAAHVELDGYKAALLALALMNIDKTIDYDFLSEREKTLLLALAETLKAVGSSQPAVEIVVE